MDSDAKASLERARLRDFYKYYPPLIPGILDEDAADTDPLDPIIPSLPESSPDPALTAFAQLGALRLNTKRALISLFNHESQHILAEATRTLSLQSDADHEDEDELWLGCSIVARDQSLCSLVLDLPTDHEQDEATTGVFVIDDVAKEQRLKNRTFVPGPPNVRFYAGAPIRSPEGINIGVYCVMDDEPRQGLDSRSRRFLSDMAKTVMEHLGMARAQRSQQRSEIMVRGIGQFIEGKTAIHDRASSNGSTPRSLTPRMSKDFQNDGLDQDISKLRESLALSSEVSSALPRKPAGKNHDLADSTKAGPEQSLHHNTAVSASRDLTASNVTRIFSRASNVIREALELDGVIFYEVMVDSSGAQHLSAARDVNVSPVSTAPTIERHSLSAGWDAQSNGPRSDSAAGTPCGVLGFSTTTQSSNKGDLVANTPFSVAASFIRSLVERYPEGRVIRIDELGNLKHLGLAAAPHMKDASKGLPRGRDATSLPTRHEEVKTLLAVVPEARNLAFLPLWDFHRERWFAGALIWSKNLTRVLNSESDLGYLAAFGNSIMAEVSRLDAVNADRAKADFISSISHELRSPLHGILGNAEFLQETHMNAFQRDMIHSIDICGKTLLDTINHVLDFAKINNSQKFLHLEESQSGDSQGDSGSRAKKSTGDVLHDEVDISTVMEEVTDTVFAGHVYRNPSQARETKDAPKLLHTPSSYQHYSMYSPDHKNTRTENPANQSTIMVILDIGFSPTWQFVTQAGAWRRVLMNALGNSLKYTTSGYIQIKLSGSESPSDESIQIVTLTVSDTGRGISKQFLRDFLFTPFTQEDPHMAGVGLGLSIMRQVVSSLGGTIDIRSEKHVGTEVEVSIPLPRGPGRVVPIREIRHDILPAMRKNTKGMRVGLVGFEYGKESSAVEKGKHLLESALRRLCEDWFEMVVFPISSNKDADADLYIATKSGNDDLMHDANDETDPLWALWRRVERHPVIVIMPDAAVSPNMVTDMEKAFQDRIVHFVAQPCGPQKLARALNVCFEAEEEQSNSSVSPISTKRSGRSDSGARRPLYEDDAGNRGTFDNKQAAGEDATDWERNQDSLAVRSAPLHGSEPDIGGSTDAEDTPSVMLVEDNSVNLRLLEMYMKKNGYLYRTATNGQEAIDVYMLFKGHIKCVLMDITMPVMDGMEATRKIRQYERNESIKPATIIALTGLASEQAQQEAFDSGFDLYMIKPVKFQALGETLKKHGR